MSIPQINQLVRILMLALVVLGLALFVFRWVRKKTEAAAKKEIAENDSTLIGLRAIAVTELRPNTRGEIRSLLSAEKEDEIALTGEEKAQPFKTFPAISSQYISKGRLVRVTGGDNELYRVRPSADTSAADKK
ncbi:MAG: hypothetical protein GX777_08825 [Fastidiosipila sp.]|nr:hypothetical protein [Fastidiosipila sp.]